MDPEFDELLDLTRVMAGQFLSGLPTRPVAAQFKSPDPRELPAPIGAGAALQAFRDDYEDALSGSAGTRYFGFVTGGSTPAALAADWLVGAYDQNLSNDVGSVASAVERETVRWLAQLFGLPEDFAGSLVSGATAANTVALACARQWAHARLGIDVALDGLAGAPAIRVLAGAAHSSIDKALSVLGMGRKSLERLPCLPGRTAIDPAALESRLAQLAGQPVIVIASAGEVNTGDFDDLQQLAALCRKHPAWLHVDGAFGLFAALLPDRAARLRGLEGADSITVDLHKWLNVPYDSGLVYTRHPSLQRAVFRATSAYLGDSTDPLHGTPENSRRFRALPAWISLRAYGRDGIAAWVQRNCDMAVELGQAISDMPELQLLSPVHLNIVCFALRGGDPHAEQQRDRFLQLLAADGRCFMTPTVLFGRPAIRAALSNWATSRGDLELTVAAIGDVLRSL